jgi:hypothetical protein
MFDPQPHLIKLPRKVKDRATGHYTTVYDDYLEVKWRLSWFRDRYPHGVIETEEICVDLERGYARYKATVADGQGGTATGYGTETAADFADYCERAETRALGRALAALGIGTQFVGQDLTDGDHVADAPVRPPASSHGHAPEADVTAGTETPEAPEPPSPPAVIPTDAGLPCGGMAINALKPAQLAMLVSKVARLVHDEGERWVPLLAALQAERAARLAQGQRLKLALIPPAEADVPHVDPPTGEGAP